jgi:hypothetical protein
VAEDSLVACPAMSESIFIVIGTPGAGRGVRVVAELLPPRLWAWATASTPLRSTPARAHRCVRPDLRRVPPRDALEECLAAHEIVKRLRGVLDAVRAAVRRETNNPATTS